MTKIDYLNLASDLRRSAYFVATGEDDELIARLMSEIKRNKRLFSELDIDLRLKGKLLAEELLMASAKILQAIS